MKENNNIFKKKILGPNYSCGTIRLVHWTSKCMFGLHFLEVTFLFLPDDCVSNKIATGKRFCPDSRSYVNLEENICKSKF